MLITCPKCFSKYQIPEEVRLTVGRKVKCSYCQHVFTLSEQELSASVPNEPTTPSEKVLSDSQEVSPVEIEEHKVFEDQPVFQDDVPQPFVPVTTSEVENKKTVGVWVAVLSLFLLLILLGAGIYYRDALFDAFSPQVVLPKQSVKKVDIRPEIERISPKKSTLPVSKNILVPYVERTPYIVMLPQIQSVRFEKRLDPVPTIRIEGVLKNITSEQMQLPAKVRAIAYNAEGAILFEKEIYLTDLILPAGEEKPFFGSYQPAPDGVQWVDVTF